MTPGIAGGRLRAVPSAVVKDLGDEELARQFSHAVELSKISLLSNAERDRLYSLSGEIRRRREERLQIHDPLKRLRRVRMLMQELDGKDLDGLLDDHLPSANAAIADLLNRVVLRIDLIEKGTNAV